MDNLREGFRGVPTSTGSSEFETRRDRPKTHAFDRQSNVAIERKTSRHHEIWRNSFDINDGVFSARPFKPCIGLSDLGQCSVCLFVTFLYRYTCCYYSWSTDVWETGSENRWPCPSLERLKLSWVRLKRNAGFNGLKMLQLECQHQNVTLCEIFDTKSLLFARKETSCNAHHWVVWLQVVPLSPAG